MASRLPHCSDCVRACSFHLPAALVGRTRLFSRVKSLIALSERRALERPEEA